MSMGEVCSISGGDQKGGGIRHCQDLGEEDGGSCRGQGEGSTVYSAEKQRTGRRGVAVAEEALKAVGMEVCDDGGGRASALSDANGSLQEALNGSF
ncbi:hypothetical protein U1Q18_016119 [Sarracenia purpurea var. burkii]